MKLAKKNGLRFPPILHDEENISIDFKLVQKQKMEVKLSTIDQI